MQNDIESHNPTIPLPPSRKEYEPWVYSEGAIPIDLCDKIKEMALALGEPNPAHCNFDVNTHLRDASIWWLPKDDEHIHIYEHILGWASTLNAEHYGFDITGAVEHMQITQFKPGDHFDAWHMDRMPDRFNAFIPRKLSLVACLSDKSEYEGGEFEFNLGGDCFAQPDLNKGNLIAFPSFILHHVKPVTKGERWSLVLWLSGPAFK